MKKSVHNNDYLRWTCYTLLGSHNFIPNWCTSRLPCGNFIPKFGRHLFSPGFPGLHVIGFPGMKSLTTTFGIFHEKNIVHNNDYFLGSRTSFSLQMAWMRFQASPKVCEVGSQSSQFEVHLLSPPATRPAFLHQSARLHPNEPV